MEEAPKKITLEDKIAAINKKLDEYESSLGLPAFQSSYNNAEEIKKYLSMSREQLEALSPGSCAEIGFILTNYAGYIQRAYNREEAILNWANRSIKYVAAPKTKQYTGSFDQKELQAIREDEYCRKLYTLINEVSGRLDRLKFISSNIKELASHLRNIQISKAGKS